MGDNEKPFGSCGDVYESLPSLIKCKKVKILALSSCGYCHVRMWCLDLGSHFVTIKGAAEPEPWNPFKSTLIKQKMSYRLYQVGFLLTSPKCTRSCTFRSFITKSFQKPERSWLKEFWANYEYSLNTNTLQALLKPTSPKTNLIFSRKFWGKKNKWKEDQTSLSSLSLTFLIITGKTGSPKCLFLKLFLLLC